MLYDVHIPRCTHIKTNGTQCGSPALRGRRFCFFHKNWQGQRIALNAQPAFPLSFTMPVLEDADSVQVALMQVMRLILAGQLDPKIAGLLLYALQTASLNLRHMQLEPVKRESVVIDPASVSHNGVDDDPWDASDFEEDEDEDQEGEEADEEEVDEGDEEDEDDDGEEENEDEENDGDTEEDERETQKLTNTSIAVEHPACGERSAGRCRAGIRPSLSADFVKLKRPALTLRCDGEGIHRKPNRRSMPEADRW